MGAGPRVSRMALVRFQRRALGKSLAPAFHGWRPEARPTRPCGGISFMASSLAAPLFCAQAKSTACGDTSANAESAFPAYKTHGWAKCWRPAVVASRSAKSWFALFCEKERLWSSHRRVEPSGYVHISAALRINRPNPSVRRAKPFPKRHAFGAYILAE